MRQAPTKTEPTPILPSTPAILFLPVSGPVGSGEYYRCLMLAEALREKLPNIQIDFGINKHAKYVSTCPFNVIALPASPTKSIPEIRDQLIEKRYQVVVFDCAGRAELFRIAQGTGAKTIFISSRPSARRKGMRWRWLPYLDEHWSVQPSYLVNTNSRWERLKARLTHGPTIHNIGSIYPLVERPAQQMDRLLVTLGGGGNLPEPEKFQETLHRKLKSFANDNNCHVDWVLGANAERLKDEQDSSVTIHASLPPAEFISLMATSKVVLTNGGSTLSQAVELGCKVVSTPLAPDQHSRVKITAQLGYSMACETNPTEMIDAVQICWNGNVSLKELPRPSTTPITVATERLRGFLSDSHTGNEIPSSPNVQTADATAETRGRRRNG